MYERGRFGIEYTPPPPEPETNWLLRSLVVLAVTGGIAVAASIVGRLRDGGDRTADEAVVEEVVRQVESDSPTPERQTDSRPEVRVPTSDSSRSVKVRNLLLRLSEAEKRRDLEMAVTTIEQLRTIPDAADLDDVLARRLGVLNMRRLFQLKSQQWVETVTVRRGDSSSRIAYEHASTLASMAKLNDFDIHSIRAGQKVVVMNHPRFALTVSRRSKIADLSLNGKFFKRYYLTAEITGGVGSFTLGDSLRGFAARHGVQFKATDRAELEMLLPAGAAVYVKEF